MGLATIITMIIYVAVPLSEGFVYLAQVLFWIDVLLSSMTCFGVPLYMYSSLCFRVDNRIMLHEHSIDKLTAVWLLPVVAPIVAAATGANLCAVLPPNSNEAHSILIASYILWGTGVPFAMSILVLYIYRLTVYKVDCAFEFDTNGSFPQMKC